tara:strand:- start:793 stop:927 length:135 start_codon:yes stop_codon:yes gene_type:complete
MLVIILVLWMKMEIKLEMVLLITQEIFYFIKEPELDRKIITISL